MYSKEHLLYQPNMSCVNSMFIYEKKSNIFQINDTNFKTLSLLKILQFFIFKSQTIYKKLVGSIFTKCSLNDR